MFDLSDKATQESFANLVGVSQGAIQKRVSAGKLPPDGTLLQWLRSYCESLRDAASGRLIEDDGRRRREAAEAHMAEMKAKKMAGELIDREGYERAAQTSARVVRDALVSTLPSKISLELAALSDPWQVECCLRSHIRAELHAVCEILEAEANAAD